MEPTTENIAEMENKKTEQSTDKENETVEQIQDKVKETNNENPGETVVEEAHVKDNKDSSCPMVIEEGTSLACHSVIPTLDKGTNDEEPSKDGLPKMDNEVTSDDKNSQLETSTHLSPSSEALNPEEGLISPTVEDIVEKSLGSNQVSSDTLKNEDDSVKVDKDTSVDDDEMATIPDNKTSEDKESLHYDAKTVIEQGKPPEEHDMISSGNQNKVSTSPDTKVVEENNERIDEGEGNNMNLTDHGRGVVSDHQGTTMDIDKGPEVPVSETFSKLEDNPSEPLIETSMDVEKEPHVHSAEDMTDNEKRSDVLPAVIPESSDKGVSVFPATQTSSDHGEPITTIEAEPAKDMQLDAPDSKLVTDASLDSTNADVNVNVSVEVATTTEKKDNSRAPEINDVNTESVSMGIEAVSPSAAPSNIKIEVGAIGDTNNGAHNIDSTPHAFNGTMSAKHSFLLDDISDGNDSGTEEDQSAFMKELENFFRERNMEFKPPKFYGEGLNCLKLFRAVTRLGGYDKVTGSKLWRQVGESFRPPKTCTTVSWTFRGFYEKALLEYERHKVSGGELQIPLSSEPEQMNIDNQASGSGRARRDAAARAMQGWHSQRVHGNGEVSDPTTKDKNSVPQPKREKQIVTPGLLKRKRPSSAEHGAKNAPQMSKPMLDVTVVDVGQPADWVKINVQRTQDCFEVYALVPGLVREEVRVQSDPAGRLVISGEPENPSNPWGATPFKKVVSLPARIDPHHTSAVVTLNGQLFVRVPLEKLNQSLC